MASTYLTRTLTNSNQRTFTFSCWVKRSGLSSTQYLLGVGGGGAYASALYFMSSDEIEVWNYFNSSYAGRYRTSAKYRDVNAWLHILMAIDTTQSTDTDRFKLYVNGELITNYAVRNNTAQNQTWEFNSGSVHEIGRNASNPFDGSMSHVHFCDGQQLAPTVFGETDSTTGEWKIKADASFTPGTNGFTILKDGNTITDQSANSNDFTVGAGTLTKTEDCPSNVFCTLNPLDCDLVSGLSNGNNTFSGFNTGTDYSATSSTLSASSGKFYWEAKVTDLAEIDQVGVRLQNGVSMSIQGGNGSAGLQGTAYGGKGVQFSNGNKAGDGAQSAYMGGFSANDIIMVALDLDNNKITFGRNGQWSDGSGNANQTYANSTAAFTNLTAGEFYCPAQTSRSYGSNSGTTQYNFGNGYFGTTAVSSAGTNASGNGIFEYDVPSGFTALSTKGLNL